MLHKIIFSLSFLIILAGCKKYPEDTPPTHLTTAKMRLTSKTWITEMVRNRITGADFSGSNGNDRIVFKNDGSFDGANSVFFHFKGNWEFINRKNAIHLFNTGNSYDFKILRLDSQHLVFENDSIYCRYR